MKTQTTTTPTEGWHQCLVRQVLRALKKTKRSMFWDIEPDEDDIRDRLGRCLKDSYTETEAVESVIEGMLHSHQEFMCNAVRDQVSMATKTALASLPNAERSNRGSANE